MERSNKIFNGFRSCKLISKNELKYFTYSFKEAADVGKLYFLPKIQKPLSSVPELISNSGSPQRRFQNI